MKYCRSVLAVTLLSMLAQIVSLAQQTTPQNFYGFLMFHRALSSEIATRSAAGLASAEGLEAAAIVRYGVSRDDFAKLTEITGPLFARLEAIDQEALAYKATAGANPDLTTLQTLYSRRLAVLAQGMETLRQTMSPAGWAGITVYINTKLSGHKR